MIAAAQAPDLNDRREEGRLTRPDPHPTLAVPVDLPNVSLTEWWLGGDVADRHTALAAQDVERVDYIAAGAELKISFTATGALLLAADVSSAESNP